MLDDNLLLYGPQIVMYYLYVYDAVESGLKQLNWIEYVLEINCLYACYRRTVGNGGVEINLSDIIVMRKIMLTLLAHLAHLDGLSPIS